MRASSLQSGIALRIAAALLVLAPVARAQDLRGGAPAAAAAPQSAPAGATSTTVSPTGTATTTTNTSGTSAPSDAQTPATAAAAGKPPEIQVAPPTVRTTENPQPQAPAPAQPAPQAVAAPATAAPSDAAGAAANPVAATPETRPAETAQPPARTVTIDPGNNPAVSPASPNGPAAVPAQNPAPGAQAAAEAAKAPGVDEAFELKVKSLEENVNELKEKIFRTKARLLLLQETVLGGDITAGAKAILIHRNEMGSQFVLESVSYALDGAPIFTRVDNDGDLDKKQEIEIFNGRIVPGNHAISVKMQYRGHGYGVFSYLEGYKFRVQSSYTFDAEGGKVTQIKIVGYEKGNITTDLKDRPAVKYDVEVMRDTVKRASAEAQSPASSGAEAPAGSR